MRVVLNAHALGSTTSNSSLSTSLRNLRAFPQLGGYNARPCCSSFITAHGRLGPHVHACSQFDVIWFLFLGRGQNKFIEQIHKGPAYVEAGLRLFLSILGTRSRATSSCGDVYTSDSVKKERVLV